MKSARSSSRRQPGERLGRVTWVVGLIPNKMGGFERTCAEFARQAQARATVADFVFEAAPCELLARELALAGATCHVIPDVGVLGWRQALPLWLHLRRSRPDVVHLHFCEFYVPFFAMMAVLRIPLVATYHYSGDPAGAGGIIRLLKHLRRLLFSGSLQGITAVSNAARQKFLGDYLERPERVTVIYNGTNLHERPLGSQQRRPLPPVASRFTGPKMMFVGALTPEKGVQVAIEAIAVAMAHCPTISLSIAGEGPDLARLQRLAEELGANERVAFLGIRDDIPEILADHDIMLVPSVWKEAFGYVLIEAMAVGCPVIASSVGGIPEVISDGEEGVLVPPGDVGALSEAILRLWRAPDLRQRLAANALQKIRSGFSLERVTTGYWLLYGQSMRQISGQTG